RHRERELAERPQRHEREQPEGIPLDVLVAPDAARYAVVLAGDPLGGAAIEHVAALDEDLPALLRRSGLDEASAGLAGDTALAAETVASIVEDIGRIALAALLVNFVFLALFLRALVAPLYLLAASALGLSAALGVTVLAFRELFGYGDITYYVPFAAAVLLLSLGSDYNLFVVGRIWQEAGKRPTREAIAIAAPRASSAITIAGIALAGSFALLALVPLRPFREFAFAMSAGILIDTFIVRTLLVPSLIALFGERSWWPGRRRSVAVTETAAEE
ncbi:MAG: MMPL family transporter, partial [Actinobacteria bacterium]|nr:MMPL family transporter [Actinomycetota bacterium]